MLKGWLWMSKESVNRMQETYDTEKDDYGSIPQLIHYLNCWVAAECNTGLEKHRGFARNGIDISKLRLFPETSLQEHLLLIKGWASLRSAVWKALWALMCTQPLWKIMCTAFFFQPVRGCGKSLSRNSFLVGFKYVQFSKIVMSVMA